MPDQIEFEDDQAMFDQLELTPETEQERQQLIKVLKFLLNYPSNKLAKIHSKANRLGKFDQVTSRAALKREFMFNGESHFTCECCHYIVQEHKLNQFTSLYDVVTLGEATKLFFNDVKYCIILMLVSFLVYGLYSFITNIASSNANSVSCFKNKTCKLALIGLGSKLFTQHSNRNNNYYIGQVYLGLLMVIVWGVIFVFKTFRQRKISMQQDNNSATASDFTVMFTNLPKHYTKESLQAKLDEYADNMRDQLIFPQQLPSEYEYDGKFTIVTFNPVRAYYQTLKLSEDRLPSSAENNLAQAMQQLRVMIRDNKREGALPLSKERRESLYRRIDDLKVEVTGQKIRKLKIIEQTYRRLDSDSRRILFVTFNHSYAKVNLLRLNELSILRRIQMYFRKGNANCIEIQGLMIERAPEPQDVVWQNIGVTSREVFVRRMLTYFITILLLGASFAAIYGLSRAQQNNNNITISLLLSLIINLINILLCTFIQILTLHQKDYTTSKFQISVGFKVFLAQIINSVVVEMIAAYYIKNNIYQEGGLVDDVFYFALLNGFFPPLIRAINPYFLFIRALRSYYSTPNRKLYCETQFQFNQRWEAVEFEIGLEYVYILKTVIYTAFFISLQPVIVVFAIIGCSLMYQAEKFALFYQSIRPKPSSDMITLSMNSILYFSVIAYGFGSLTWTNFLPQQGGPKHTLAPNIISICIGVILYFVTYGDIADTFTRQIHSSLVYEQQRLFLPSEYDRLNPITKSEGLKNFIEYLQAKRKKHKVNNVLHQSQDQDDKGKMSLFYIDQMIYKSKHQSRLSPNFPLPVDDLASSKSDQLIDSKKPVSKYSKYLSIGSRRNDQEVQAAIQRIQNVNTLPLETQQRLNIPEQKIRVDTQQLKSTIAINALPGQHRPGMLSSKFSPIDYIEAVNLDRNSN